MMYNKNDKQELTLWLDDETKIISFHKEENFEEKVFTSKEDFKTFILVHGSCGYRFQ